MRFKHFFWLCVLWATFHSTVTSAQTFPVQVTTAVRPPYSLRLSDYANPNYDRIQANIYMADLTQINYRALVRLVIKGPGGIEISSKPGSEVGPIFLNGGSTEILTGAELNELFKIEHLNFTGISLQKYKQNAALPEGIYQFHFEIRDFNNPQIAISSTATGFASAWLILNDPPIINQPANGITIEPQTVQNIFFQWSPRHTGSPNAAFTTEYQLQLAEIYPSGRNANDAMLSSPPIFETTTYATAYNYGITDPSLVEGHWYAFRVKAQDTDGLDFFKNQGYSEVFKFYYGKTCPLPPFKIEQIGQEMLRVSWDTDPIHHFFSVRFRPRSKEITIEKNRFLSTKTKSITKVIEYPWVKVSSTTNELIVENLDLTQSYEFQVQGLCQNNESPWSSVKIFTSKQLLADGGCAAPMQDGFSAILTNNGTEMKWDSWPQFTNYILKYHKAGTDTLQTVQTADNEITEKVLDLEEVYEYQLSYTCQSGGTAKGTPGTFTLSIAPDYIPPTTPPTGWCFSPANVMQQVINDTTAVIQWEEEENVKGYTVAYKKVDGSEHWTTSKLITQPSATIDSLAPNTTYTFSVTSICKDGLSAENGEEHQLSTAAIYSYQGDCDTPIADTAKALSGNLARLFWTPQSYHTGFLIEVKKNTGNTWHEYITEDSVKTISALAPETTYQYRIAGKCGVKQSQFTEKNSFTTLGTNQVAEGEFICGTTSEIDIQNQTPVNKLLIGDNIKAADFEMEVTALESRVPYNGQVRVSFPYFNNARITLQMVNVKVNQDYQLYDGYLYMLSADALFYEMPTTGKLAYALTELDKLSGNYLENLDLLDGVLSDVWGSLNDLPDIKQALSNTFTAIKSKLSKAKEAQKISDEEKGEALAKQAVEMMKSLIADAVGALMKAPEALENALSNFNQWVKEVLKQLNENKNQKKRALENTKNNLWGQIAAFFEDLFDESKVDKDDVRRVYTKTIKQEFSNEEYKRFKLDPNWEDWNALVTKLSQVEWDYEQTVKFYNYTEVFLIPNNIGKLTDKLKADLGESLATLGREVIKGVDTEARAKELIEELLVKNIEELIETTSTTDVTGKVDRFLRQFEVQDNESHQ